MSGIVQSFCLVSKCWIEVCGLYELKARDQLDSRPSLLSRSLDVRYSLTLQGADDVCALILFAAMDDCDEVTD